MRQLSLLDQQKKQFDNCIVCGKKMKDHEAVIYAPNGKDDRMAAYHLDCSMFYRARLYKLLESHKARINDSKYH